MPEPSRGRFRQGQRNHEADTLPCAACPQPLLVAMHCGWTARAEQRHGLDRLPVSTQVEIGRPTFHLVAEKKIEDEIPVVHTTDGTVGIYLHAHARGAFEP